MSSGNRAFDLADRRAEEERAAGVLRAQRAVAGAGQRECEECGEPIAEARRRALPSATRCIGCQHSRELNAKAVA